MNLLRFHLNTSFGQQLPSLAQRFFGIIGLCSFSLGLSAQSEGGSEACFFSQSSSISCEGINIQFGSPTPGGLHHWDFGDNMSADGPPPVVHLYHDVNSELSPITAIHTLVINSETFVCSLAVDFPGIFLGTGCGSVRKISEMVAAYKLPANELVGKTLYVFGNLEVDASYVFNGCSIFVSEGGKITVKSGATLSLKNNTVVDVHTVSGLCQNLWNGIEVLPGGALKTNGAVIRNAYFAISTVNPGNINPLPKLSLQNTTFQRNFVGMYAAVGRFVISLFLNNTFEGSGNNAIYPTSSCNPPVQISGDVPYLQRTYCGIYFDGSMGGSLLLAGQSTNNIFKDMQAGIVCINGTSRIGGCRFDNIAFLFNNTAKHQGTALTFIDNVGGKRLNFVGLGKENALATINNCERGVYALSTKPATEAYVSACRMTEVQNGVELDESGTGNYAKGSVNGCYIGCTKYLPIIKMRSMGIEVKDPNIAYSNFNINNNTIDADQPEAFIFPVNPNIIPTGIMVTAMHSQTSNNAMALSIGTNVIDLTNGQNGIVVVNVANANIIGNEITNTTEPQAGAVFRFIWVFGGFNNSVVCNIATNFLDDLHEIGGVICEGTLNVKVSKNTLTNQQVNLAFVNDNGTDCTVSYNDLTQTFFPNNGASIVYNEARTGPQYLQGNDWVGGFSSAQFGQGGGAFSYCESLYHVSDQANIHDVLFGAPMSCDGIPGNEPWFTILEVMEDDFTCSNLSGNGTPTKNAADLHLAGGGLSLSPGYKWTGELELYRKFTENPNLTIGDAVINGFLQAQQGQPVAAMYGVRNSINGIEGNISASLLSNIQNTLAQLEANEASLLALLESIETDPNGLASFTTLSAQTAALEQLLQTYLASASSSMALSAAYVQSTNNSISSSALPCAAERYINGLYLETQVIAPRALTATELQAVSQIGTSCPEYEGSAVYLARALYYLQTGAMLEANCSSFAPPYNGGERNKLTLNSLDYFTLMPNPADGNVQINLGVNQSESTLFLSDLWGRLILQRKIPESDGERSLTLPTEAFANGTYFVSIKDKTGKSQTQRLNIIH